MTVVLRTGDPPTTRVAVRVSPLAELVACLHALTEADHHAAARRWRTELLDQVDAQLARDIARYAPLWSAYRSRVFYPLGTGDDRDLDTELDELATLPTEVFSRLTAYACAGGYTGLELDRVLDDAGQRRRLLATARAASTARVELANALLDDPESFRTDLFSFLVACRDGFFNHTWTTVVPRLQEAAEALHERFRHEDLATALASLSDTAEVRDAPRRVVLDKFHHSLVDVADEGLLLIPSWYGWPHLIVKHEPGLVPVVQFAVSGRGQVTPRHQVHTRLDALSDPGRLRLCRLIAREPLSTSALAERVGMTEPQVSRHLRKLREAGLVRTERDGRFVYYSLDLGEVARLGSDVLTALLQ